MLNQEIKISVIAKSEEDIKYQLRISNGINSSSLDFYGYEEEFRNFGEKLISFPQTIDDIVIYELGEDTQEWAYYLKLKVFCYEPNGYSAIHILIDNHQKSVNKNRSEFYIKTISASLNKLGAILKNWNPMQEDNICWQEKIMDYE